MPTPYRSITSQNCPHGPAPFCKNRQCPQGWQCAERHPPCYQSSNCDNPHCRYEHPKSSCPICQEQQRETSNSTASSVASGPTSWQGANPGYGNRPYVPPPLLPTPQSTTPKNVAGPTGNPKYFFTRYQQQELQKSYATPPPPLFTQDTIPMKTTGKSRPPSSSATIPAKTISILPPGPDVTLLVIGESGAGKSTFINAVANYIRCGTLKDTDKNRTVLIPAEFRLSGNGAPEVEVKVAPTVTAKEKSPVNEHFGRGQSATQDPKCYKFTYKNSAGKMRSLQVIDTPGICDSRGLRQDEANVTKILDFIANYKSLKGICILVSSQNSRLTPTFKFCISKLLEHLDRRAAKNIVFGVTKAKGTNYRVGDTSGTLRTYLDDLHNEFGIRIDFEHTNTFTFDNEAFRYIAGRMNGMTFSRDEFNSYEKSFNHSRKEFARMLNHVSDLPAHDVSLSLCLNNTKQMISVLSGPLAEASRNLSQNKMLLEDRVKHLTDLSSKGKSLQNELYYDQVTLQVEKTDMPTTVCTHETCIDYKKFDNMEIGTTIYKTECHSPCYLTNVVAEVVHNPALKNCAAMNGTPNCQRCGHSWEVHMHIRYKYVTKNERVENGEIKRKMENHTATLSDVQGYIKSLEDQIREKEQLSEKITNYSAKFARFIQVNSIVSRNDAFLAYLEYLMENERLKNNAGFSSALSDLEERKRRYIQELNLLNTADKTKCPSKEQISQMINDLKTSSEYASLLGSVQTIELLSVNDVQQHQDVIIPCGQQVYN